MHLYLVLSSKLGYIPLLHSEKPTAAIHLFSHHFLFAIKIKSNNHLYQLNSPQKLFPPFIVLDHVREREVVLLDVVTQFRVDLRQD